MGPPVAVGRGLLTTRRCEYVHSLILIVYTQIVYEIPDIFGIFLHVYYH